MASTERIFMNVQQIKRILLLDFWDVLRVAHTDSPELDPMREDHN